MLKIGMKYCGGCQEYYDRIAGARIIQSACKDCAEFSPTQENKVYDLILVICGCTVLCPDYQNFQSKHGHIVVCGTEDYENAIHQIKLIHKQEAEHDY